MKKDFVFEGEKSGIHCARCDFPDYICMDGSIPRKKLGNVLNEIASLSKKYGLAVANCFHAGDGNLHPLIMFDSNNAKELKKPRHLVQIF